VADMLREAARVSNLRRADLNRSDRPARQPKWRLRCLADARASPANVVIVYFGLLASAGARCLK